MRALAGLTVNERGDHDQKKTIHRAVHEHADKKIVAKHVEESEYESDARRNQERGR